MRMKTHSKTSPDLQLKEFLMTKQTTGPRMEHEWKMKKKQQKSERKQFFVQTPFFLYFKIRVKNSHRKTTRKRR